MEINEAFEAARREVRDMRDICRELLDDNERLRVENEKLRAKLKER